MTKRITGECWNVQDNLYRIQVKTTLEHQEALALLPGWDCVSFGYIPETQEDILVFEKQFITEKDWTNFTKTDTIIKLIELREV
jgi:hypothetical protein